MKYATINNRIVDLDKVVDMQYEENVYIMTIIYRSFLCFTKKVFVPAVLESDYFALRRKWEHHQKEVLIHIKIPKNPQNRNTAN